MAAHDGRSGSIGRRNAIPIIYTSGTYYEVGFDVGRTFRGLIEDFLESSKQLNKVLLPAYEKPEGRQEYDKIMQVLNKNYPHYVRELQGTADGARVPFHKLMLLHMDMVIPQEAKIPMIEGAEGCSTFCSNYGEEVLLGHTEDALPAVLNHVYIVNAHIKETNPQGRWKTTEEKFSSLCYAGTLPGFCMSYNEHGLVYSINLVFPLKIHSGKTPRCFLTRALLSAKNMKDVEDILLDSGVGSADGISINYTFVGGESNYQFYNTEVGPSENTDESILSTHTIKPGEHLFHANMYQRLAVKENLPIDENSSTARQEVAKKFGILKGREKLLKLLSDQSNADYSIYRDGSSSVDCILTVNVGLFDVVKRTWTLWIHKPAESDPIAVLPMIFKRDSS